MKNKQWEAGVGPYFFNCVCSAADLAIAFLFDWKEVIIFYFRNINSSPIFCMCSFSMAAMIFTKNKIHILWHIFLNFYQRAHLWLEFCSATYCRGVTQSTRAYYKTDFDKDHWNLESLHSSKMYIFSHPTDKRPSLNFPSLDQNYLGRNKANTLY